MVYSDIEPPEMPETTHEMISATTEKITTKTTQGKRSHKF